MGKDGLMPQVTSLSSISWILDKEESKPVLAQARESISADAAATNRWMDRENDLKIIRRYRDDWDGMGAKAASSAIIDYAIMFLNDLKWRGERPAPDAVVASPEGGIIFVWESKTAYAEAQISELGVIDWMFDLESGTTHSRRYWTAVNQIGSSGRGLLWDETQFFSHEPAGAQSLVG